MTDDDPAGGTVPTGPSGPSVNPGCTCSVNDWIICPYCSDFIDSFRVHCPTDQKEPRGHPVFTAVRRWRRRLGDWLDPHAAIAREARELTAEWWRQHPGEHGRHPGPDAGER